MLATGADWEMLVNVTWSPNPNATTEPDWSQLQVSWTALRNPRINYQPNLVADHCARFENITDDVLVTASVQLPSNASCFLVGHAQAGLSKRVTEVDVSLTERECPWLPL